MNGAAFGAFVAAGQTCVSGKRILIHESIYDDFVAKLVAKVDGFALGDPLQVISRPRFAAVESRPLASVFSRPIADVCLVAARSSPRRSAL